MQLRVVVPLSLLLAACAGSAVTAKQIRTGKNEERWQIECWHDENACGAEARVRCPDGHRTVGSEKHYIPNGPTTGGRMLYQLTVVCE